jgi:hypothetical protein
MRLFRSPVPRLRDSVRVTCEETLSYGHPLLARQYSRFCFLVLAPVPTPAQFQLPLQLLSALTGRRPIGVSYAPSVRPTVFWAALPRPGDSPRCPLRFQGCVNFRLGRKRRSVLAEERPVGRWRGEESAASGGAESDASGVAALAERLEDLGCGFASGTVDVCPAVP